MNNIENIVANGTIARYEKVHRLSQCFQMWFAAEASENVCMRERVNAIHHCPHQFIKVIHVCFLSTFSHIQHFCIRQLWNHEDKNMENLYKWMETIEKSLLTMTKIFFVTMKKVVCCRCVRIGEIVRLIFMLLSCFKNGHVIVLKLAYGCRITDTQKYVRFCGCYMVSWLVY